MRHIDQGHFEMPHSWTKYGWLLSWQTQSCEGGHQL